MPLFVQLFQLVVTDIYPDSIACLSVHPATSTSGTRPGASPRQYVPEGLARSQSGHSSSGSTDALGHGLGKHRCFGAHEPQDGFKGYKLVCEADSGRITGQGLCVSCPLPLRLYVADSVNYYRLDPSHITSLAPILQTLLADRNALVLGTAIAALEAICPDRLDLLHTQYRRVCRSLIDTDEWSQIVMLRVLERYARTQFADPSKRGKVCRKPNVIRSIPLT